MSLSTPSPTLEMVTARAGVSRATVSRVVNASPKVTTEVDALVSTAIAELTSMPNRAARSLASRQLAWWMWAEQRTMEEYPAPGSA